MRNNATQRHLLLGFIRFCPRLSSSRGHSPLHWTLGDPQRSVPSEGVKVEPCSSRRRSHHAHCSRLTVSNMTAVDTGRYSCEDASDHTTSIYVYVQGEAPQSNILPDISHSEGLIKAFLQL